MENLLELADQRTKSLQIIKNNIEAVKANISQERQGNQQQANLTTEAENAIAFVELVRKDAFQKGISQGYANACNDLLPVLDGIMNSVVQEEQELERLNQEAQKLQEDEQAIENDESEDLVPLD